MKSIICLFILCCSPWIGQAQDRYTITGTVKDKASQETLVGVTVQVKEVVAFTVTDVNGSYSITLPAGTHRLQFSYVGYALQQKEVELQNNTRLDIELVEEIIEMQEVIIQGKPLDDHITNISTGHTQLNMEMIKKLPTIMGEADLIKNIQLQPGVTVAGEGTSSYYVRGGSADQNLILYDGAPIYDPSHLFGIITVFNPNLIKESQFYRGGIPSRFGGRLSSILEVKTKEGNDKFFSANGAVSPLAAQFMMEGPVKNEISSFLFSFRRSLVDIILRAANQNKRVDFFDLNIKLNWTLNNRNKLYVSLYKGQDNFLSRNNFSFGWGNTTGTLNWDHAFGNKLFLSSAIVFSNFDYGLNMLDPTSGQTWESQLSQTSLKNDFNYELGNGELSFGYQLNYQRFQPGILTPNNTSSIFQPMQLEKQYGVDHALYVDHVQNIGSNLAVSYGARLSVFQAVGKTDVTLYHFISNSRDFYRLDTLHYDHLETIKTYINLEPRVGFRYRITSSTSLKASYNRMVQNTHLISSGTVPLPFNTWSPSGYYLKPQLSDQFTVGLFKNLNNNTYETSVEAYYKDIDNVTDFADNAKIFFNPDIVTEFRQGKSWAYGLEFSIQKKKGKLTGFANYTLSKAERKVDGVNMGNTFAANHDRRNVINAAATYDLNSQWSFGAIFSYATGRPITLPSGRYEFEDGYNVDVITTRNGYRLPDYHRLDLAATFKPNLKPGKKWSSEWVFSLYNAYNRKNPFTLYTRVAKNEDGEIIGDGTAKEIRMVYLFPILPSIAYHFKF
jgi:hypothetical protein